MPRTPRETAPGPPRSARLAGSSWPPALLVVVASFAGFVSGVASSRWYFADESAYYSQSYFAETYGAGRFNDPHWLTYPAYDLPPLPKYLIGAALRVGGYRTPGPAQARAWYRDTSRRFDPPGALAAARVPVAAVGALGCAAVYGIGVLVAGRGVGLVAALLLAVNPLYRLQSRRAMSDVPCEAFMLLGLFFGLLAWKRATAGGPALGRLASAVASGVCAGFALLSKLSGLLALMVFAAWTVLALGLRADAARARGAVSAAVVAGVVALLTVLAFNPYLTARPAGALPPELGRVASLGVLGRARLMFRLRFEVANEQKAMFTHNALNTPGEKLSVAVVQGFGRFGPFGPPLSDSTRRFDRRQDWGAVVWLPWVAAGCLWAASRGRSQRAAGEPPTAWAALLHFAVAFAVVTLYLPMAWDRYLLPVQAPAALLAAGAAVAAARRLTGSFARPRGGR